MTEKVFKPSGRVFTEKEMEPFIQTFLDLQQYARLTGNYVFYDVKTGEGDIVYTANELAEMFWQWKKL